MNQEKGRIVTLQNSLNALMTKCPICRGVGLTTSLRYHNTHWPDLHYFDNLCIIGCEGCGFGFTWPELPDQTVNEFYTYQYRRPGSLFYIDFIGMRDRPMQLDARASAQLLLAQHYVKFREGDSFIELGPGNGGALNVAEKILPNPNIIGIELNLGAATAFKRIYGAKVYSSVQEAMSTGYRGKICLLSHSLEHFKLSWLKTTIRDIKNLLEPDGVLIIEVPLVDVRKHRDRECYEAPHFLFFSLESIKLLFESNGWSVLHIDSCGLSYEEWRRSKVLGADIRPAVTSYLKVKLLAVLKRILNVLPVFARNVILKIFSRYINRSSQEYSFGGDRTCLRLVARPVP